MSDKSAIEWTDSTWNPIRARNKKTGKLGWFCVHASEGCRFCYSEKQNVRGGDSGGNGVAYRAQDEDQVELFLDEKVLLAPLHWKKPRKIFPCSMTDLFGEFVKDEWLDKIFAVMALCPQHTFQVLTKRAERMRDYLTSMEECWHGNTDLFGRRWGQAAADVAVSPCAAAEIEERDFPFPNVWLGVSAERQEEADARIPLLLQTPAAVRFVSCEPLLGPIDLSQHLGLARNHEDLRGLLHWIIVGGESGPKHKPIRPMHPQWARDLRDQCVAASVAFFFKQWGEWAPHKPIAGGDLGGDVRAGRVRIVHPGGEDFVEVARLTGGRSTLPGSRYMARVGKARAGRLLDGREWNEFPEPTGGA